MKAGFAWIRKIPLVFWILIAIQGTFTGAVHYSDRFAAGSMWMQWTFWSVLVGIIQLLALSFAIVWISPKNLFLASSLGCGVIATYGTLLVYHFRAQVPLSYPILQDNWRFMERSETWQVALSAFERADLWCIGLLGASLLFLEVASGLLGKDSRRFSSGYNKLRGYILIIVYILAAWTPWSTVDEFQLFIRSVQRDRALISGKYLFNNTDSYPYWTNNPDIAQKFTGDARIEPTQTTGNPNVWILLVESFNRNYLLSSNKHGQHFTPFLNHKIQEGLLIDPFYANSTFTIKGWAATLVSVYPAIEGYLAEYSDTRLFGLPEALETIGYETFYYQAYKELDFANTGSFMEKLGVNHVLAAGSQDWPLLEEEEESYWGWGLQDNMFYKKAFRHLDQSSVAKDGKRKAKLVLMAPISSHSPFNQCPESERRIYKNPENIEEHYANSIALADHGLQVFFEELERRNELENNLVIICGDHSFPMGEHGVYRSESGAYEEFFRTPLMIWWSGRIPGERRTGRAITQMDLAPTILNWIGYEPAHPFQGSVIPMNLKSTKFLPSDSVPCILFQPYGGRWFVSVRYPMKYIYHAQTGWEGIFNLGADPQELQNLAGYPSGWNLLPDFRKDIARLYLNQKLIESNCLRPPEAEKDIYEEN